VGQKSLRAFPKKGPEPKTVEFRKPKMGTRKSQVFAKTVGKGTKKNKKGGKTGDR